jgi:hypothetical protein
MNLVVTTVVMLGPHLFYLLNRLASNRIIKVLGGVFSYLVRACVHVVSLVRIEVDYRHLPVVSIIHIKSLVRIQ